MWVNAKTGGIFDLHTDIRHECWKEGKEMPGVLNDEILKQYGYFPIIEDKPKFNMICEKLFPRAPELVDGEWRRGWNVVKLLPEQIEINEKIYGERKIRQDFFEESTAPVECVIPEVSEEPIVMDGGFQSAQQILGAHDLAKALGEEEIYLTDVDNTPHKLPTEAARKIAVKIGVQWREAFFKKQMALNRLLKR